MSLWVTFCTYTVALNVPLPLFVQWFCVILSLSIILVISVDNVNFACTKMRAAAALANILLTSCFSRNIVAIKWLLSVHMWINLLLSLRILNFYINFYVLSSLVIFMQFYVWRVYILIWLIYFFVFMHITNLSVQECELSLLGRHSDSRTDLELVVLHTPLNDILKLICSVIT